MTTKTTPFTATDIPSQTGRRVLITGANSGIGYEAALELARRGAEVILPARSLDKANDAIARIRREVPERQTHSRRPRSRVARQRP